MTMTSVQTMVDNVIAVLDGNSISWLNILDHGNPNGIQIGDQWITAGTLPHYSAELGRLTPYFSAGATVHLQHCESGQNRSLMRALAGIWNVTVRAGTGLHNSVLRVNYSLEPYVLCNADRCWDEPPPPPTEVDWSRKACCFAAGTSIHTPQGFKAIETLEEGDSILAWNPQRHTVEPARLEKKDVHAGRFPVTRLETMGKFVSATDGHRFAVDRMPWTPTEKLSAKTPLCSRGGVISLDARTFAGYVDKVYNLVVEGFDTFLVGDHGLIVRDH
ncbi:DUF4347 domain-containing protein [Marivita hallyeonensis]|uniref:DUF4347 domain-containing protein n=1 Tax=Marivita hallyeonensis TaxID=996342 RepID=UPI0015B6BCDA|nr:DUF4347 domain-containing protein [Marivita hallyeonensis]